MSLTSPRISIPSSRVQQYNKILQSCLLSRRVYNDVKKRDVIVHRNGRCIYVCFKGCSSLNDFITSVDIRNCRINGESVGLHNGFCEKHRGWKDEVYYGILEECMKQPVSDIVFTGHSAGGSLAQICSLFANDLINGDIQTHCYTFGSPKVGDECFKDAIEETLKDNLLRIETFNDIVCLLPMQSNFEQAGKALILGNPSGNVGDIYQGGNGFFDVYHKEYFSFVRELKANGLLNKQSIMQMVDDHSCDSYTNNIVSFIKKAKIK